MGLALCSTDKDSKDLLSRYQNTDVGVIPSDWLVVTLGLLVCSLDAGISVNSYGDEVAPADDDLCILKTSCVVQGKFNIAERKVVIPRDRSRVKTPPIKDRIIISRMNTPALVGECGYVDADYNNCFLPDRLWITRHSPTPDHYVRWLAHLLSSPSFNKKIKDTATGTSGSMKNIAKEAILSVPIPLPPTRAEQEAIAEALSDADAYIESLERLIAKKRAIKQGAMQELLTGKRRLPGFSGKWESTTLGQLGRFLKGSGVRKDQALTGSIPCVRYGELYTHHSDYIKRFYSWVSPEVASTATPLQYGDILFAGSGETKEEIGKCAAFLGRTEAYAGGDIVIFRSSRIDPLFLGYYCNTERIAVQKASKGQGDAVVHISSSALSGIAIDNPSIVEQSAIAAVLSDIDEELQMLEDKLAKARHLKQGMMQQLLTGRIRLI
jgi:type I restriction enzyme S subunit